jgi:hypothetical protein
MMKKLLKILGNQAVDPADQNIIDTLRKEVKTERLKDMENTGFDRNLISHITSADQKKYSSTKYNRPPQIDFCIRVHFDDCALLAAESFSST